MGGTQPSPRPHLDGSAPLRTTRMMSTLGIIWLLVGMQSYKPNNIKIAITERNWTNEHNGGLYSASLKTNGCTLLRIYSLNWHAGCGALLPISALGDTSQTQF